MSELNLLSGKVTLRRRKVPILWTGEMAQHVAENFINKEETHPFLHIPIQQAASNIKAWYKSSKSTYRGYGNFNGIFIVIIIEVKSKFVIIKTCYKGKEALMKSENKNDKLSGIEISKIIDEMGLAYPDEIYQEEVDLGMHSTIEEAKESLDRFTYETIVKPQLKKKKKS